MRSDIDVITHILKKHLDSSLYQAFIFGSAATQSDTRTSDIDIGITGKKEVPDSLLVAMRSDLEESDIKKPVDLVDFSRTPDSFNQVAQRNIIPLSL